MITRYIILQLFFIYLVLGNYCGDWTVIDWTTIPKFVPSDSVEVRLLVAPLLYCSYENEFSYLNLYHAGLSFTNRRTGYSVTVNFDAFPNFSRALFPLITKEPNGTYNLTWGNNGKVFLYSGVNTTYWNVEFKYMAEMSGSQFNQFMIWTSKVNGTDKFYNPWYVYKYFPDQVLLSGYECFQFVVDCLVEIQLLGGKLAPGVTSFKQSIATLYSWETPKIVSFSDPNYTQDIIDFYQLLEVNFKQLGPIEFFEELLEILVEGKFYVYDNINYYFVDLALPYFWINWTDLPFPVINSTMSFDDLPDLYTQRKDLFLLEGTVEN